MYIHSTLLSLIDTDLLIIKIEVLFKMVAMIKMIVMPIVTVAIPSLNG